MKKIFYYFIIIIIPLCIINCSEDKEQEQLLFSIENKEFLLFKNHSDAVNNSGEMNYLFIENNYLFIDYAYSDSDNGVLGYSGKVHDFSKKILDTQIPETGLKVIISGTFNKSNESYSAVPEIISVEFYTSSSILPEL